MQCTFTQEQCSALIALADEHQRQDEYVSGSYEVVTGKKWEGGCAIGCTIYDARKLGVLPSGTDPGSHSALADVSGVPLVIWRLADAIFEGLPQGERAAFTPALLRTIRPGVDYSRVAPQFSIFVMLDCRANALPDGQAAIDRVIGLLRRQLAGEQVSNQEFESAARSAARSAESARSARSARSAAESAWSAAESAWSAAESAWSAARSAWSAAESAWSAAESAWSAAESAAESAAFARFRDELLRLMNECQ